MTRAMTARRVRLLCLLAATPIVLSAPSAAAFPPSHHGVWDEGVVTVTCGTGRYNRTCTYSYRSTNCTEAGVAGVRLHCTAYVSATVAVVPQVQAGDKIVGCTSTGPGAPTNNFDYDSDSPNLDSYDVPSTVTVEDTFEDGKPGVLTYVGTDGAEIGRWVVRGAFETTCRAGARGTFYAPGAGWADVTL